MPFRALDHNTDCLTRSELYALWGEAVNTLKRTLQVKNVCAHLLETDAGDVKDYIRANLSRFTVITGKCSKRKVCHHHRRIKRTLELNLNLVNEYACSVTDVYRSPRW
ncbi:lef11 [Choristoneura murinana nucleopolyhedrovirus]|uniref:Late expression factor 11 n=1 Tax=Choristoneura murinana nucleopolyhedrovirus TaxID=1987479 RepID=V9XVI1_9ABAC|nr:lef11 [Choristoneura murinana nucleopolyhedrovirus]AHD25613.1 lef11 [Choristoneura murinana nucleopolyhedrovirus]BBU37608.1 late expression factor 11 [Choristoneura diversana nucleopolyhedrovirus]